MSIPHLSLLSYEADHEIAHEYRQIMWFLVVQIKCYFHQALCLNSGVNLQLLNYTVISFITQLEYGLL